MISRSYLCIRTEGGSAFPQLCEERMAGCHAGTEKP